MSSLQYAVILLCVTLSALGIQCLEYRPINDSSRICLATYFRPVSSEFLIGKWYYVYLFASMLNLPASSECREILFERPTGAQLDVYRETYNETGMPYAFEDDSLLYRETWGAVGSGLLLGGKEAKVFLERPRAGTEPAAYEVVVLEVVNQEYAVHQDCALRGFSKWLISRKKHPSQEELQEVINSRSDLKGMEKQKYCQLEEQ